MNQGRKYIALVVGIIISGVAIRLLPNILNYAWGNDYGIYYYLSESFLSSNSLAYPPNSPWGTDGYQYFPVTYLIVDGIHYLFHIPVSLSLDYSIPILGGLTPFLLYLIARETGLDRTTSALAGFLLVVSPIQLYQTSQPNYLTTGHFFLLLSILFFLAYHRKKYFLYPMSASIVLLVLSHQLSTYFFLISITGMVFSVNLLSDRWKNFLFSDVLIIEGTGTLMIGYLLLRIPGMVHFFSKAVGGLGYVGVIILFYAMSLTMFFVLRKVDGKKVRTSAIKAVERLKLGIYPKRDFMLVVVATLAMIVVLIAMIHASLIPSFVTYRAVLISTPFLIFIAVSIIGIKYLLIETKREEVLGWSMAIVLSLLYSFFSRNTVLLPARHIEYLSEPFSIIAAAVLIWWYIHYKERKEETKEIVVSSTVGGGGYTAVPINTPAGVTVVMVPRRSEYREITHYIKSARRPVENLVVIVSVSLVLLMGVASYPMVDNFVPSHTEAMTLEDNATIQYLVQYGNRSLSVATDHQIGILLYSYGFVSPFNNISVLWNSTDWHAAIWELTGNNGSYPPIGYVLLDSYMLRYGVWGYNSSDNPNQPAIMINQSSFKKFFQEPFELLYTNSSTTSNSTAYLFSVNWTYLGEHGYSLPYYYSLYEKNEAGEDAIRLSPTSQVSEPSKACSPSLSPPSLYSPSQQRQQPYLQSPGPLLPVLQQPLNSQLSRSLLS